MIARRKPLPCPGDHRGVSAYLAEGRAIDEARRRRRELLGGVAGVVAGLLAALVLA